MISAKGERNMLFLTCAAHRLWQGCLSAGFCLALIGSAAAEDAPAEGPSAAGVEARVIDGRLTLQADGTPLAEVLRAIGAAGGFEVVLRGAFATPVSAAFADRPLEDAIRELAEGHSMIVRHDDPDPATGVTAVAEIRVLENPDLAASAETAADEPVPEADVGALEDDGEYALSEREAFRLANRDVPPPTRDDILIELGDPDQAKRVAAVPKVGALQPGAAADVLAGVFAEEDDPLVRSRAVAALTRLEGPGARMLLRERALGDDDAELRMQALNALATTDGERSVNLLGQALRDDGDLEVRKAAISALQRVGGDWARRPLERAVRDPDPSIRTAAEQALEAWSESPD
jgi:HEAT repeats